MDYHEELKRVIAVLFSKVEIADAAIKEVKKVYIEGNIGGEYNRSGQMALDKRLGGAASAGVPPNKINMEIHEDIAHATIALERLKSNLGKIIDLEEASKSREEFHKKRSTAFCKKLIKILKNFESFSSEKFDYTIEAVSSDESTNIKNAVKFEIIKKRENKPILIGLDTFMYNKSILQLLDQELYKPSVINAIEHLIYEFRMDIKIIKSSRIVI